MSEEPLSQASHTRVPNLVSDVVLPLLTPAERDCLHYVIRRTYGFADPAGGRKARDTISLEQFENGISSGNYLLDLGTQLSRNTIRKALDGLEEKGLVEVRQACTNCFWEQTTDDQEQPSEEGRAPACPRCRASLSRSWAMSELTPRKLVDLLNKYDKKGRTWSWDTQAKRFRWEDQAQEEQRRRSQEDLRQEALRLRRLLWYPDLVDQAAGLAEKQLKSSKLSLTRRINNFYKPVWEMQEKYSNPPLLKYSLEQTIKGPALRNPDTHRWYRYLTKVIDKNHRRFSGRQPEQQGGQGEGHEELRQRELAMRDLLGRAAQLNGRGEFEEARSLLSDILSQVKDLSPLFDDDRDRCENSLREAFKQGSTDFVGIKPKPYGLDFYKEWSWPTDAS